MSGLDQREKIERETLFDQQEHVPCKREGKKQRLKEIQIIVILYIHIGQK
jgi:hypothetical protein